METKASKADGLPDLYGGMFYALLVGACAAIVGAVFLINSGSPLLVTLEDSVLLGLAVALVGNIPAYILDRRSGEAPRMVAGILTAVVLTAGIVALKVNEPANRAAASELAALAATGPRPATKPKVNAKPVNQKAVCGTRPRQPHFLVYDTKSWEIKTGPEVEQQGKDAILNELQQRTCIDPALLFDLLTYHEHGIDSPVTAEDRQREIQRLIDSPTEWDKKVEELLVLVKRGNPQVKVTGGSYTTWWHVRGDSPAAIPGLRVGDLRAFSSSYLMYETAAGSARRLRLNCGFQPFEE